MVFQVSNHGPAVASGLRPNDVIKKVNGDHVTSPDLWTVRNLLKGKPGTKIEIHFERNNEEMLARFVLAHTDLP